MSNTLTTVQINLIKNYENIASSMPFSKSIHYTSDDSVGNDYDDNNDNDGDHGDDNKNKSWY